MLVYVSVHVCVLQSSRKKTPIAPHKISEEIFPSLYKHAVWKFAVNFRYNLASVKANQLFETPAPE